MGLGSGFLEAGDIVIVALGCYTPIILRQDVILHQDGKRNHNTYRFVGDIYIDGYMYGEAVEELAAKKRELESFVLRWYKKFILLQGSCGIQNVYMT